ncbi:MAG: 3-phosphoshikimate 1-carboxyvinyltransferase [Tannerella sp.]|jgi:3-phosphoshikimate 1-carboxyvinyltransferase|nr:3-phosphoshikimate 1-carboxyvinyltransferase [Tannerella sp.]
MNYRIKAPEILNGNINLPASKSISNRVLILNSLCHHPKHPRNISVCDDTGVMIDALYDDKRAIDIGAAGTAMRFLTAYFSVKNGTRTITGTERMKNRPIKLLVDALRSSGAEIEYVEKEGFPPLHIKGQTLAGGHISLDGGVSSQYISALLMIAPLMTNGLSLHLTGDVISVPYIKLTVRLMRMFGVVVFEEGQTFTVPPQQYSAVENFTVEPDWSAASYWYEMIALCKNENARISLPGLLPDSLQGDAAIVALFDRLGVKTTFTSSGVTLTKKEKKTNSPLTFDFISMPDMAQTAAVTCAMLGIPFRFSGLQSLKIKETDRLEALKTELCKFGYPITVYDGNTLEWNGQKSDSAQTPVVATYEDHRMAMAFAPVAICRQEGISISDPEVVSKSYPSYWEDLQKTGFSITSREHLL